MGVDVGGTGVDVGGTGVDVGGAGVDVGGAGVDVGGIGAEVGVKPSTTPVTVIGRLNENVRKSNTAIVR
jgi:iron complex outermembrane receptor protein